MTEQVERRCQTCECAPVDPRPEVAVFQLLTCQEGPVHFEVHPEHFCFRWRIKPELRPVIYFGG